MGQKAFTKYECASKATGLGHSSVWTGARPSDKDETCLCGQPLIAVVPDGFRYKVEFESISPHQAAEMEARYGPSIWALLSNEQWDSLDWCPVVSDQSAPNVLRDQYQRLLEWAKTREQPIRNVRFFQSKDSEWEEVTT